MKKNKTVSTFRKTSEIGDATFEMVRTTKMVIKISEHQESVLRLR